MSNLVERAANRRLRRSLRRKRKDLTEPQQEYLDLITSQIWSEQRDVGLCMSVTEETINRDASERGFDPATILLLVQLALLIYKALKFLGFFSISKEQLTALVESE